MALEIMQLPRENESDPESSRLNFRAIAKTFRSLISFAPAPISVTSGITTLTTRGGTIFADCTAGAVTLNPPTAAAANIGDEFTAFKKDTSTNTLTFNGNVLGGNSGQSKITLVSDGSAWRVKLLYDEGAYTATLTGCTTNPTATVKYERNGKGVTFGSATLTGASNTTACTATGMPSHIWPAAESFVMVPDVRDNSVQHIGYIRIQTNGVWNIEFYSTITTNTSTFTNVNNKGFITFRGAYSLQ